MTFEEWKKRVGRASIATCEYDQPTRIEPVTRCKHGRGDCDECGTSDRRDALHTTKGGRGAVGRIAK